MRRSLVIHPKFAVEAALRHEVGMPASLGDPAAVEHHDLIRMLDRGQAMGDDEQRSTYGQRGQGVLDESFGLRVREGRRLIEHQDRSIGEQRPRNREPRCASPPENRASSPMTLS